MAYKRTVPPAVRAWLDSGLAAHRAGDLARAEAAYRNALAMAPENADALNLLGTALLQAGAPEAALAQFEHAAAIDRTNAHVLANLAQCCLALGRHEAAHDAFRKASRLQPGELHFQVGAASALALQGKLADAENILQRLARRAPSNAVVWFNLGHVMRDQQRRQEAIDCYQRAVALEPAMADARNALGSALHSKLRFKEAEAQYRECIRLAPGDAIAHFNLASVLMDLGRFGESESAAREVLRIAPQAAEAHRLVGTALGFQTRLAEAHVHYQRAAALEPDSAKAAQAMAMSLAELGHLQPALRFFSRALQLGADSAAVRPLRAAALLADGAIPDGWRDYRARFEASLFREKNAEVSLTQEALFDFEGRHVCVIGEQGLGDEIFFLRYAPALARRGARLTYRAGPKIASLLARAPFLANVITSNEPLPSADAYVLAADLPHATTDLEATDVAATSPCAAAVREFARRISIHYPPVPESIRLDPLPDRLEEVRKRLDALGPPPYIGVTWRAGTLPDQQRSTQWVLFKTVPLEAFGGVLSRVPGTLIALQREPATRELETLASVAGREMHDLSGLNDDLEAMLALLALVEDYVGVSNTNMHLRAAVGRTARVLVPAPAEWRWMRSGDSPWFPGFSIYRQSAQGSWDAALRELERDLAGTVVESGALTC